MPLKKTWEVGQSQRGRSLIFHFYLSSGAYSEVGCFFSSNALIRGFVYKDKKVRVLVDIACPCTFFVERASKACV